MWLHLHNRPPLLLLLMLLPLPEEATPQKCWPKRPFPTVFRENKGDNWHLAIMAALQLGLQLRIPQVWFQQFDYKSLSIKVWLQV